MVMMREATVIDDIGAHLRSAREQRNLSLDDLSKRTKLSIATLQAIERNDFERLPGGFFRKAYVRTVAGEVGLDPDEMAAAYCARFEPPPPPVEILRQDSADAALIQELTPPQRRSFASLLALTAPAVAWFILQSGQWSVLQAGHTSPAPSAPLPAVVLADTNRFTPISSSMVAPQEMRIEIAAKGPCWITAEADGTRALYRLVEPGERVVLEARERVSLRLGDAGSVLLSINGGVARSFGGHAEVVTLIVTPGNVERLRTRNEQRSL